MCLGNYIIVYDTKFGRLAGILPPIPPQISFWPGYNPPRNQVRQTQTSPQLQTKFASLAPSKPPQSVASRQLTEKRAIARPMNSPSGPSRPRPLPKPPLLYLAPPRVEHGGFESSAGRRHHRPDAFISQRPLGPGEPITCKQPPTAGGRHDEGDCPLDQLWIRSMAAAVPCSSALPLATLGRQPEQPCSSPGLAPCTSARRASGTPRCRSPLDVPDRELFPDMFNWQLLDMLLSGTGHAD